MTYRVVQDQPCKACDGIGLTPPSEAFGHCDICNGDGTRMVEVAVVKLAPNWWWSPFEQAATAGKWGHGDDRAVWVEVEP